MATFTSNLQNKSNLISRRMFILSSIKVVVFVAIISRLFYLQISENIKWRSLSDKNRLREWKIAPQRGIIEDYFGTKIAKNTQVFQLHMIPEDVPDMEDLFFKLSRVIDFNERAQKSLISKLKKRKPWEPIIISHNLTWPEFSRLNLFLHEIQGIKPVVSVARKYLDDASSAHIIGYVGDTSVKDLENSELLREINIPGLKTGKNGLEKYLNEAMIGKPGLQRFEVNAYGKRIRELKFISGTPGNNFRTTIDQEIQKFASASIKDRSASVCVMDIFTGDIVAMVSNPTFDPNKFVHGISKKDWENLIKDKKKPLVNKSMAGLYPPGSTIKPVVAFSALENDVVSPKFVVECRGHIEKYDRKYHCWKEKGHGFMNLRNAIKQSCDIYFYEVARLLGVDRLNFSANKFGLGKKVLGNIFENEKEGIFPSTKWKKEATGQNWYLGETFITGIGQGYIQTNPLQLTLMTAQLANGGHKIYPKIIYDPNQPSITNIKKIINDHLKSSKNKEGYIARAEEFFNLRIDDYHPLYKNPENVKFVLNAMFRSTNEVYGTSYRSRIDDPKYQFAGKTGTSQVKRITEKERELDLETSQIPYKDRDHAWFIAFGPYKDPRYAMTIFVEHGGSGSKAAAPLAKKLFKLVIDRHEIREKIKNKLLNKV